VNASHLDIIPYQQRIKGFSSGGFLVTNANCSSTGLVIALKPLQQRFGLESVSVVTMQAISGAGYPGVSALDITDNVIPFISGEEPKLELEPLKILGELDQQQQRFCPATFNISAQCNRVATIDGHMECVNVKLKHPATLSEVIQTFSEYESEAQQLKLPSAPPKVNEHNANCCSRRGKSATASIGSRSRKWNGGDRWSCSSLPLVLL